MVFGGDGWWFMGGGLFDGGVRSVAVCMMVLKCSCTRCRPVVWLTARKEPTQTMGGFIDHAYWKDNQNCWESPKFERYSPYFSDHDALCITLMAKVILF